ncbi:MAG: hypothetical protein WCP19_14115, partial [Chloroflexota bacterium]
MIEIQKVSTSRQKQRFLTFPWQIYKNDPLWVPPILSERQKASDPGRGIFFQGSQLESGSRPKDKAAGNYADYFMAYKDGQLSGTICCSHEEGGDPAECSIGFFECIDDYSVAEALFQQAETWARGHGLTMICGTYNLDREDGRGILLEGYDRPPVLLCGHNPPYYGSFFERFGFGKRHDDGLAYAIVIDPQDERIKRLFRLAERVKQRKHFTIRNASLDDLDNEIDRILILQNRALEHLPGFVAYTREAIAGMLLPLKDLADPELVLFVEDEGKCAGWFPAIPNFNEILIHLNGLRYPWDYISALRYKN